MTDVNEATPLKVTIDGLKTVTVAGDGGRPSELSSHSMVSDMSTASTVAPSHRKLSRRIIELVLRINGTTWYWVTVLSSMYVMHIFLFFTICARWCSAWTFATRVMTAAIFLLLGLDILVLQVVSVCTHMSATKVSAIFAIDLFLWMVGAACAVALVIVHDDSDCLIFVFVKNPYGIVSVEEVLLYSLVVIWGFRTASRMALFSTMQKMHALFMLDADDADASASHSGRRSIALAEVRATIKSFDGLSPRVVSQLLALLDEADVDGNGELDPAEYHDFIETVLEDFVYSPLAPWQLVHGREAPASAQLAAQTFTQLAMRLRSISMGEKVAKAPSYGAFDVIRSMARMGASERCTLLMAVCLIALGSSLRQYTDIVVGNIVALAGKATAVIDASPGRLYNMTAEQASTLAHYRNEATPQFVLWGGLLLGSVAIFPLQSLAIARATSRTFMTVRKRMILRVLRANTACTEAYSPGKMCSIFASDVVTCTRTFEMILSMGLLPCMDLLVSLVLTFTVSKPIGLLFLSFFPAFFAFNAIGAKAAEASKLQSKSIQSVNEVQADPPPNLPAHVPKPPRPPPRPPKPPL